ncbi:MAG TPA: gamma-glutamyltransferase, partial [Lacibacter sp.]|nr:gamma-glutamyltransferase [Lacibacter sp.]
MRRLLTGLLVVFFLNASAQYTPYRYEAVKKVTAQSGAVVSAHPLASEVGLAILRQGGNAFDAAIATQLALAVVYPGAGNLGGGGFLLAYTQEGKSVALDYREKAPAAAHRDLYLDSNGNAQTNKSQNGHLSSGVPGTVSGLFSAHSRARLPFDRLIQPAIDLAEKGFVLTESEARNLNNSAGSFILYNTRPPAFIRYGGWKAGDTLIQKDLARTLRRIRDKGREGFYTGPTARLIVEEMRRGGGLITLADLRNYRTAEREAMVSEYNGHTIIGMPLISSGGLLIQQMLGMTAGRNIGAMGVHSPEAV